MAKQQTFYDRFILLAKAMGMPPALVCMVCGLPSSAYESWKSSPPTVDELMKVSLGTKISTDYLLFGKTILPLSQEHIDLLNQYNSLLPEHKGALLERLDSLTVESFKAKNR